MTLWMQGDDGVWSAQALSGWRQCQLWGHVPAQHSSAPELITLCLLRYL